MSKIKGLLDHLHPNTRPYAIALLFLVIAPPVAYGMLRLIDWYYQLSM